MITRFGAAMDGPLSRGAVWLTALFGLCACAEIKVTESTVQAVTIHYYGAVPFPPSLDDATAAAARLCAAHGETAHLRKIDEITTLDRYAHYDCVKG